MLWLRLGASALVFAVSGHVRAHSAPPAPAPPPDTVVAEQHPIQVGDVIMAPRIEGTDGERDEHKRELPPPPKPQPRRWYGAPILVADGLAYGSIGLAAEAQGTSGVTLPLGIGTFLLAGPIVHAAHRRWGRMGLSLAARTALPFAGLVVGASGCVDGSDCLPGLLGLTVVGMVAASIIDVSALAYEPITPPPSARPTVQPTLSLARDRLWLGASGVF
jgi:hypothetical protein